MFGQNAATTPFGSSAFGTTTGFGAQPATPFGQSTSGGLFGSKTPVAGTFGTPTFGSQTPAFGTTSTTGGLFGAPTASTGGSLFGQQSGAFNFNQNAQASTGLFGSSNVFKTPQATTNVFGQTSTGFGGFGTTATTQATSTGLFGSPFGTTAAAPTSTGLFGGGFGATAVNGTTVKLDPVKIQEQVMNKGVTMTIQGVFQCITAMNAYKGKSVEELRLEDYTAGRKGGTATAGGSLFGATAPATGLFGAGSSTGNAFGGFGQTQATGTNLFGTSTAAPVAQTGGLFGAKPLGTGSLFGTATTSAPASGFGGFGTQSTGLFGQTSTGLTGGLFGGTSTGTSTGLFGATTTATPSTGLFGATGFGQQQQTGGLFGAAKPLSFNTATTAVGAGGLTLGGTSTGLFGNTAATAKPAFSFNPAGTSTFGTTAGLGTGLFGGTASTGLFGQTKPAFGSTFGSTLGGGLGTTGLGTGLGTTGLGTAGFGLGTAPTLGTSLDQSGLAMQQQQQLLQTQLKALTSSPFGDSPLFRNIKAPTAAVTTEGSGVDSQKHKSASSSQYKVFSRQIARPNRHSVSSPSYARSKLFEGMEDDSELSSPVLVPRRSVKKLVIKQSSHQDKKLPSDASFKLMPDDDSARGHSYVTNDLLSKDADVLEECTAVTTGTKRSSDGSGGKADDLDSTVVHFGNAGKGPHLNGATDGDSSAEVVPEANECGVTLTRKEYYTVPSMDELVDMCDPERRTCVVKNFKVGRRGYGHVTFLGETNVFGINIDSIVFFRRCEVEVYPEHYKDKPEVGHELNKKAEIGLEKVWPTDKSSHTPIKSPNRLKSSGFLERLEEKTIEMDARFIDYQPDGGVWVFQVDHFTKYGLFEQLSADPKRATPMQENIDPQTPFASHAKLKELLAKEKKASSSTSFTLPVAELRMDTSDKEDTAVDEGRSGDAPSSDSDMDVPQDEGHSSYQYARGLGLKASRVHEMKASFFDECDDDDAMVGGSSLRLPANSSFSATQRLPSAGEQWIEDRDDTLAARLFNVSSARQQLLLTKIGAESVPPSPVRSVLASKRVPKDLNESSLGMASSVAMDTSASVAVHSMIVVPRRPLHLVNPVDSLTRGKQSLSADSALVNGRRCRIGWTTRHHIVHLDTEPAPDNPTSRQSLFHDASQQRSAHRLKLSRVGRDVSTAPGFIKVHLDVALRHCQRTPPATPTGVLHRLSSCRDVRQLTTEYSDAAIKLNSGSSISGERTDISASETNITQHAEVWTLVDALWGPLTDAGEPPSTDAYRSRVARSEALSRWLGASTSPQIEEEITQAANKDDGHLDAIFSMLSGRRIADACRIAGGHREHRLALLIAQACGDQQTRHLIRKQLSEWEEQKVDQFMSGARLRIFTLLAGLMVWRTSQATVNVCRGLPWKRAFALHQWFHSSSTASIEDAVAAYRTAFEGCSDFSSYASPPHPPYIRGDVPTSFSYEVHDVCYLLLRLYCDRSQSLETLLNPLMSSGNPLDWHLTWHLQQVLESLHYDQLGDSAHDLIQASYASQLETAGLWHWACFVAMHYRDDARRESSVREIVSRHCLSVSDGTALDEEEQFVIATLHVPSTWIHQAKAMHASVSGHDRSAAVHMIEAAMWNQAHSLIVTSLAPDYVINGEIDSLCELLDQLDPPDRCCSVTNWRTGGKVYLDYMTLEKRLRQIEAGLASISGYHLEDLEAELASLVTRVNRMGAPTPKHRLCQSEIAKRSSDMLKIVSKEMATVASSEDNDDDATWSSSKLANHLTALPLPPDYCLREFKGLVRNFTRETARANDASGPSDCAGR